jgi:hypothetical protein
VAPASTRLPDVGVTRAAIICVVAMNPNTPAAVSSTVSVGCSRKESSVVPASVVTIDSSDHA